MDTLRTTDRKWGAVAPHFDEREHVRKYVFTSDTAVAEAVLYEYDGYANRTVICCSVQSGCPIGCRFCGAGDHFVRNLTSEEIVEQVNHCLDETGVDPSSIKRLQIMFMSMGEPMLNRSGLEGALVELHRLYPGAALLVSTSAPKVDYWWFMELSLKIPTIGLQFSVHESTDEARDTLIPFKSKLKLSQMTVVGQCWHNVVGRKPFFNYCAHDGNVSDEDADRLFDLFDPDVFCATVSVVCERNDGLPTTSERQRSLAVDFASKLVERGYDVRVFDPAGQDTIGGGCGQLWFVQDWMRSNAGLVRPSIGHGLPMRHAPASEAA
jgi:23S rRNA (adenine2503-C2)-methyltransferase